MRTIGIGLKLGLALGVVGLLTACGANGVLGLNPRPSGDITITNAANGALLQTSSANPFIVNSGGFSIGIAENNFSGPYVVNVIQWTATFSIPCFVPHYIDSTNKTNTINFTADNAAPETSPDQANPCGNNEAETAKISDNDGHSVLFYYKLVL